MRTTAMGAMSPWQEYLTERLVQAIRAGKKVAHISPSMMQGGGSSTYILKSEESSLEGK